MLCPQREILQGFAKVISVGYRVQRNENKTFHMGDIKENKEETYHEVYWFQKSYFTGNV